MSKARDVADSYTDSEIDSKYGSEGRTQSATDTTAGRLLKVLDYGLSGNPEDFIQGTVVARLNQASFATNRVKIRLPFAANAGKMLRFSIDLYSGYKQYTYNVSGYLYATTANWHLPHAIFYGHSSAVPNIVFGKDADGIAYVSIRLNGYDGVLVRDLMLGYNAYPSDYKNRTWEIIEDDTTPNIVSHVVETILNSGNEQQIGVGQTLQDVLASRAAGTTYTNNTGKPIEVTVEVVDNRGSAYAADIRITIGSVVRSYNSTGGVTATFIVPVGATYRVEVLDVTYDSIQEWKELR